AGRVYDTHRLGTLRHVHGRLAAQQRALIDHDGLAGDIVMQQVRLLRCLGRERGGEHGAVPILDVVFGGVRCGVCRSGGSGLSGGGRGGRLCGKSGIGCRFRGTGLPVVVLRFGCANCGIRGAFHRIVRIPTQFRCWRVGKFGHDDAVLSLTGSQSGVDCRVAELAQPFDQCRIGVGITCDAGA
ncbi:hypothetical protein GBK67_06970, partial [Bifidobacterium longum]